MTVPAGNEMSVYIDPGKPPIVHTGAVPDPAAWAAEHAETMRATVSAYGSLLLRGLALSDTAGAAGVFGAFGHELMGEREAFAPRAALPDGVYSSTTWPAAQQMCMHHELSYTHRFPGLMMFACLTPPASGGATTVADAAAVLSDLPDDLVARFEAEGWMLIRNYNEDIGASVADSFGTDDKTQVEAYCAGNGIEAKWLPDGTLRTRQVRPAVVTHPMSGARCWFNQIAFLNEHTLDPEVREFLVEMYGSDGLPFTTAYGDGEPLSEETIDLINGVYTAHTRREPWAAGDVLLVDNIATAHAREPYEGPREVLVALSDPTTVS